MNSSIKLAAVTKHVMFSCAHYLVNPALSKEENMKQFHKCCLYKEDGSEESHGHNYDMEITVYGMVDPETGYVIDFKKLKQILKEGIVERLDHRLINNIPFFKDKNTTVENILHYVWEEIAPKINALRPKKAELLKIKIWETPDSFAELTSADIRWQKAFEMQHQPGAAVPNEETVCADCGLDLNNTGTSGCNSCPQCHSQETNRCQNKNNNTTCDCSKEKNNG